MEFKNNCVYLNTKTNKLYRCQITVSGHLELHRVGPTHKNSPMTTYPWGSRSHYLLVGVSLEELSRVETRLQEATKLLDMFLNRGG